MTVNTDIFTYIITTCPTYTNPDLWFINFKTLEYDFVFRVYEDHFYTLDTWWSTVANIIDDSARLC